MMKRFIVYCRFPHTPVLYKLQALAFHLYSKSVVEDNIVILANAFYFVDMFAP